MHKNPSLRPCSTSLVRQLVREKMDNESVRTIVSDFRKRQQKKNYLCAVDKIHVYYYRDIDISTFSQVTSSTAHNY